MPRLRIFTGILADCWNRKNEKEKKTRRDEKGEGMCVSARGLRFSLRAVQNVRNCTGLGHVYMTRVVFVLSLESTRLSSSIGFDRILNTLQFRIFDFLFFSSTGHDSQKLGFWG